MDRGSFEMKKTLLGAVMLLLLGCGGSDETADAVATDTGVDAGQEDAALPDTVSPDTGSLQDVLADTPQVDDTVEPDQVEDIFVPQDIPVDLGPPQVPGGCVACHTNKELLMELAPPEPVEEEESGGG